MSLQRKLSRTFGSGVYERIEETQKCFGYYGFGSGVETGRHGGPQKGRLPKDTKTIRRNGTVYLRKPAPVYCFACSRQEDCWKKHRTRVAGFFPDESAEWERRCEANRKKGIDGRTTAAQWTKEFGHGPPDFLVGMGNTVDGQLIAEGKAPEDRGDATLVYPFGIQVVQ